MQTVYFRDKSIAFGGATIIMGILNATPDSFSDGGNYLDVGVAIDHALDMVAKGADIIDIGGESTRPGSQEVLANEEKQRVLPVIRELSRLSDVLISIDTSKAEVASEAICAGAHIINDVWGFQKDLDIASVAAQYQALSILMHNQNHTDYQGDLLSSIKSYFDRSINLAIKAGLRENLIVLDPGIGFGKTPDQNLEILRRLNEIVAWGFPVLLGTSRKSTIGKVLDLTPDQRVEGTLATTALGIHAGVSILRVHDIQENVRTARMTDAIVKGIVPWIVSN